MEFSTRFSLKHQMVSSDRDSRTSRRTRLHTHTHTPDGAGVRVWFPATSRLSPSAFEGDAPQRHIGNGWEKTPSHQFMKGRESTGALSAPIVQDNHNPPPSPPASLYSHTTAAIRLRRSSSLVKHGLRKSAAPHGKDGCCSWSQLDLRASLALQLPRRPG